MTELERVAELQVKQKELCQKWHDIKVAVTKKLFVILTEFNSQVGSLPLLPLRENEVVSIDERDWLNEDVKWKVRKEIYFVSQDPNRSYDFGSTFSLYITNLGIAVNHGSSGEWTLQDLGQWTRLCLLKEIFMHQYEIIEALEPLIDFTVKHQLNEVSREIDNINRALEKAKEQKEEEEIMVILKKAKYLVHRGKHWEYPKKEDGSYDYSGKGYYKYYWCNIEKINKLTEVSVLTNECDNKGSPYACFSHRHKIKDIIRNIKYHYLYAIEDLTIDPPQEEGSN